MERTVGAALRGRPALNSILAKYARSDLPPTVEFRDRIRRRAATEGRPYSTFLLSKLILNRPLDHHNTRGNTSYHASASSVVRSLTRRNPAALLFKRVRGRAYGNALIREPLLDRVRTTSR